MPQTTDFHEYEIPVPYDISAEDTNVWGEILNETFRKLDDEVILRGTSSDQPLATKEGRLFLDTSDRRFQFDTGNSWEYVGVQAQFLDSGAHILTTPKEVDFDSDISVSKTGANRIKVDIDDSFVRNDGDTMEGGLDLGGNDLSDSTASQTLWDASNAWIPESALENNSVTVNTGNALTGGATLTLADSTTLAVDESAISHSNLADLTGTDPHTQYIHEDARRGFTNPVDGKSPTNQTHLATKDYVDSTAQGLEYKESVLAEQNTPPSSPSDGDRYLIDDSPSGDWSGHANEITEYDGGSSSWTFEAPVEGWSVFVEDADKLMSYNGTDWVKFGSTISHDVLQGLGDDDHTQYLHRDGRRSMSGTFDTSGNDITDSSAGVTVWDAANAWVPESVLENNSITVSAGNQLSGGGNVTLGGSITLNVDEGSGSGLNADQVDGYEAADLRNDKNHAQLSSTDTSTDINTTSWVDISWDVEYNVDSAFSHDATNSPATITFDEAGTYRVTASVSYEATGADVNPGLKFNVNGTRKQTFGLTGYVSNSNGQAESSNVVVRTITVSSGDTLKVQATAMGNTSPSATMRSEESILEIEQLSMSTANVSDADTLDSLDSSQFLRSDINDTMQEELGFAPDGSTNPIHITDGSGGSSTAAYVARYDTRDLEFNAGGTTKTLHLNTSGQVGVATAPSYALDVSGVINVSGDILGSGTTIWDASASEIPDAAIGSIDNSTLTNNSITVSSGDGLKNGGGVSLGGSITLDIEPVDFAGTFLSDDGADNLTVNLGTGVAGDGSGNIQLDESYAATWTSTHTFSATQAIDMSGGSKMTLPKVSSDPSASPGDMWYREDKD